MPKALLRTRFLRNLWRRYLITILYHVGLTIFVTITVVKMIGIQQFPEPLERRDVEKRAIDSYKQNAPALTVVNRDDESAVDRVVVEPIADWITLTKQKSGDALKSGDGVFNDKKSVQSLEVLGEGGTSKYVQSIVRPGLEWKTSENVKKDDVPNFAEGDIPISGLLRKRILNETLNSKKARSKKPIIPAQVPQERDKPSLNTNLKGDFNEISESEEQLIENFNVPDTHDTVTTLLPQSVERQHHSSSSNLELGRANVLIVAAMRTGSSFLGELFQQRSDFFYMFEPGRLLMHKLDDMGLTREVMVTKLLRMIREFYRCKFRDMAFFIDLLNRDTLRARKQTIPSIVSSQFCTLHDHKRFKFGRPKDKCITVSEQILETACNGRAHTAIKSIRILDINLVLNAVLDPETNLKLIHLVRDPRSMILSRLRLAMPLARVFDVTHLSTTYRNILTKYCSNWYQNYQIGHYVPFVRKNYLMVRYEDIALEPYESARRIYDFVGLGASIPDSVRVWIDKNTNANDSSKKKSAAFSTKRDSKAVLVSWKRRLTLQMAQAIEGVGDCTRLMQAAGYKLIGSDPELLTNTDHLVGPLPEPTLNVESFEFL